MPTSLLTEFSKGGAAGNIGTWGGFEFAKQHDVKRKFREIRRCQVAPISTNLIMSYVAEHVLGLPKTY